MITKRLYIRFIWATGHTSPLHGHGNHTNIMTTIVTIQANYLTMIRLRMLTVWVLVYSRQCSSLYFMMFDSLQLLIAD